MYRFEPRFFDVDGKSKIYAQNSSDAALSEFTLKGLTGDGSLTTSNLYTAFDSTKYTRANDSDLTFYYDPGTSQFAETSIFTNATRTFEWFQKVGFTNFGAKPIKLVVHAVLGGNGNNALYPPKS